jgi:hypothetical protein
MFILKLELSIQVSPPYPAVWIRYAAICAVSVIRRWSLPRRHLKNSAASGHRRRVFLTPPLVASHRALLLHHHHHHREGIQIHRGEVGRKNQCRRWLNNSRRRGEGTVASPRAHAHGHPRARGHDSLHPASPPLRNFIVFPSHGCCALPGRGH